jgi:hypothetical protein
MLTLVCTYVRETTDCCFIDKLLVFVDKQQLCLLTSSWFSNNSAFNKQKLNRSKTNASFKVNENSAKPIT